MGKGASVSDDTRIYERIAADLGVRALPEAPLAPYTTMKVGGPASWLFVPEDPESAARLVRELRSGPLPLRFLGGGSNVVVADEGVRAAVVLTTEMRRDPIRVDETRIEVAAGAGVPGLVRWSAVHGLAGLEFAEGIPARLGGAITMNAGANRSSFSEVVEEVLLAGPDGRVLSRRPGPDDFGYRTSFVGREGVLVVGAVLRLSKDDPRAIRETIRGYKARRRATQPLWERSAGCVFANWPDRPVGALVERLGLKGMRIGGAEVSTLHGNFIINRGGARADDVLRLVETLEERLATAAGSRPRLEIQVWRDEK